MLHHYALCQSVSMDQYGSARTATTTGGPSQSCSVSGADKQCEIPSLNLDDPRVLPRLLNQIRLPTANNFLVAFDDATATISVDGTSMCLQSILREQHRAAAATRWLNLFKAHEHKTLLEFLAQQYDFSPRLLAEMCTSPQTCLTNDSSSYHMRSHESQHSSWLTKFGSRISTERSSNHTSDGLSDLSSGKTSTRLDQKSIYSLASEIWHYTTIDFGRNYICCGYNALYDVPPLMLSDDEHEYHLPVSCHHLTMVYVLISCISAAHACGIG